MIANGIAHQFAGGIEVKLAHHVLAVCFDGVLADAEQFRRLLVGFSFSEELDEFPFPRGQAAAGVCQRGARRRGVRGGGVDQVGDSLREEGSAVEHGIDGFEEHFGGIVFVQEPTDAEGERFFGQHFRIMHRLHEDQGLGEEGEDFPGGVQAVELGHHEIQNDQMRFELFTQLDCLPTILGFPAHLPVGARLQHGSKAFSNQAVIVGDEDARFFYGTAKGSFCSPFT